MKHMTPFEKAMVVLITIAILVGVFFVGHQTGYKIGYVVGSRTNADSIKVLNYHKRLAQDQRDRLSDYIRMYEDLQADAFDATDSVSLQQFINELEHEDSQCADVPYMHLDDWCYAY